MHRYREKQPQRERVGCISTERNSYRKRERERESGVHRHREKQLHRYMGTQLHKDVVYS